MATDPRRAYQRGRILAAIENEALTAQQLADKLHLTRDAINLHLAMMKSETPRLLHVSGFKSNLNGGRAAPMYSLGDKKDAIYIKVRAPKGRVTKKQQQKRVLRMLKIKPMTSSELAERLGIVRSHPYVKDLHSKREIHIAGWSPHPEGGYPSPIYAVGNFPDAERPAPLSDHEKHARYWANLKADPHRYGLYVTKRACREKPQTPFSALWM